jgi:site-specific recombinase XerC
MESVMRSQFERSETVTALATAEETELFAAFVADLVARGRKQKTVESYRSDWTGLCEWWNFSQVQPFSVDVMDEDTAAAFKASLVERSMTPATINRKLVFIKRYTDFARATGRLDEKRARGVRRLEAAPAAPRRPRGLSDIELRRFLKEVEARAAVRDQAIVFTLLQTGLKVSELVGLRREQIGLGAKSGLIRLDADARGRARRVEVGQTARRKLRAWFDERGDHDGPIWDGERGPLTANAVQRLIRKYCAFANVHVSPQVLRHTFAAGFLMESHGDLVGLADALGHECLETTRLYMAAQESAPAPAVRGLRPVALSGGRG